jgi:hypothetical protein
MRRILIVCLSAALAICLMPRPMSAQSNIDSRNLKGLATVFVLVEDLPDGTKNMGLSDTTIRTDVEL